MQTLGKFYVTDKDEDKTKSKIILTAVKYFAIYGYSGVSIRDIARKSGIRSSSIYHHFTSKEELLNEIMENSITMLNGFYAALDTVNEHASFFRDILDNILSEVKEVVSKYIFYTLTVAQNTQYINDKARCLFYDLFLMKGKDVMKRQLDRGIEMGYADPFDTDAVASFLSSSIILCNQLRVGEFNSFYQDFNFQEWVSKQEEFILSVINIRK